MACDTLPQNEFYEDVMKVSVSAQKISIPRQCACCGKEPDTELTVSASKATGKRVVKTRTNSWDFPYCSRCLQHARVVESQNYFVLLGIAAGIVLLLALYQTPALGFLALLVCFVAAILIQQKRNRKRQEKLKELVSASCATSTYAVKYLGWQGSIQHFDFASKDFAAQFMRSNLAKLINLSPEARNLLSQPVLDTPVMATTPSESSDALATPAAERTTESATEYGTLLKWINKIESSKGPATRRAAVAAALKSIQDEDQRHKLLLEASKIEVAATLDKVDGLKTKSAKKRVLQAAIQELKADSVSDELQVQLLEMLESEMHQVENSSE